MSCPFKGDLEKGTCPLGFDSSSSSSSQAEIPEMSLDQLSIHSRSLESPNIPSFISLQGLIFDVSSDNRTFGAHGFLGFCLGFDITLLIASYSLPHIQSTLSSSITTLRNTEDDVGEGGEERGEFEVLLNGSIYERGEMKFEDQKRMKMVFELFSENYPMVHLYII